MNNPFLPRQLLAALLFCSVQCSFAQKLNTVIYTVTPVPALAAGASSIVTDVSVVNSAVEVVGAGYTSCAKSASLQAFSATGLSTPAPGTDTFTLTNLGTLPGTSGSSIAYRVDSTGQVTGWSNAAAVTGTSKLGGREFVTQATGGLLYLGTLANAPFGSTSSAVNLMGEVTGTSEIDLAHVHAVAVSTLLITTGGPTLHAFAVPTTLFFQEMYQQLSFHTVDTEVHFI